MFILLFTGTTLNSSVLALKRFIVVEKEQNVPISHQTMQFLLLVFQKYYLPGAKGTLATPLSAEGSASDPRPPLASGGLGFATIPPTSNGKMLVTC